MGLRPANFLSRDGTRALSCRYRAPFGVKKDTPSETVKPSATPERLNCARWSAKPEEKDRSGPALLSQGGPRLFFYEFRQLVPYGAAH